MSNGSIPALIDLSAIRSILSEKILSPAFAPVSTLHAFYHRVVKMLTHTATSKVGLNQIPHNCAVGD